MTRNEWISWARARYEQLATLSPEAADEARSQAGLPDVFVWSNLTSDEAFRLAIACRIRLMEVVAS